MQSIPIPLRPPHAWRTGGLIAAAVFAAAALAAGVALLESPAQASGAPAAGPQGALSAPVPVRIAGDRSVPSATSAFERAIPSVEESSSTF